MERDLFLSRVGQATLAARLPAPTRSRRPAPETTVDPVALFRARAQAVSTVVHGPMSRHAAPRAITAIAAGHEAARYLAWDDLPVAGIPSALASAGLERMEHRVPVGPRLEHNLTYAGVDIGITGSRGALAESGSIILSHGPGRPRMASLIPDVHIALVDVNSIHRTLADWAGENPRTPLDSANVVLVSGPSRSADIEQQLNLGVHGPRTVHVVLIR